MTGDPVDPDAEELPLSLSPMLATPGDLPADDSGWLYETKGGGVRALVAVTGGTDGRVRSWSRAGNDLTPQFPELAPLGGALRNTVLLDGELVAFGPDGKPSFNQLQQRLGLAATSAVQRSRTIPVLLIVFDVLHLDGRSTRRLPLEERRALLDDLDLPDGAAWHRSSVHHDGAALADATRAAGLEGVVAKRLGSQYHPGVRSRAWIKVKHHQVDEFVIGGWVPGSGRRATTIGSLLLGTRASDDPADTRLHWIGRVGTGFAERDLQQLQHLLIPLATDVSPFDGPVPEPTAVYVLPQLRARVEYHAFTPDGLLRFPTYRGIL